MADETQEYNSQFVQDQTAAATQAAQAAYQQGMLEYQNQQLAFQKAQQAWKESMDKAGLTGTYEGMPTQQALQFGAQQFGTWGAPQQGQQTLAGQQQDWQQAYNTAAQYGQYYGTGQNPAAGTQTQAAQQQQFTQGLQTQQEQRAAQAQQQSQAQQYLNLLSSLRGPADWAKYQQVLGSTPGGMRDLAAVAMGQYVPGGGATTGMQPEAVSLQSMMGQISGQGYNPQAAGQPLNMPNVYQQNSQGMYAPQQMPYQGGQPQAQAMPYAGGQPQYQNMYQPPTAGQQAAGGNEQQNLQQARYQQQQPYAQTIQNMVTPPAGQQQYQDMRYTAQAGAPAATSTEQMARASVNPAYRQQVQQQTAPQTMGPNNQQVNALGNGTNMYGAQQPGQPQANQMNLPAPNQIAAQSWNNMAPSQKDMLMGQYEAQGWHKPDVEALRNQALPKYAANAPTAGTWRLQG